MKIKEMFKGLYNYKSLNQTALQINKTTYNVPIDFRPSFIIGFSFGKSITEDSPNSSLSRAILDAQTYYGGIPVIAQRDIYECFKNNSISHIFPVCKPVSKDTLLGTDVSTEDVIDEARAIINDRDLDIERALFVAHPAHIFRVLEMAQKEGIFGQPFIEEEAIYSPRDGQKFVRGPNLYAIRELAVRAYLKAKKKI